MAGPNDEPEVPETHVLAIASHVTSGYVGNTMAAFCMQTLGCEVSAINTVNYSNHVGYGRFKGRVTAADEVAALYEGLKNAKLNDFDMMLSGYCPSAATVEEVGKIARDVKFRAATKPGSFFWVLDPVMGDNGRIYVAEDCVPAYKHLLKDADLILPNQTEAELLSDVKIQDLASMKQAINTLHQEHHVRHVLITSVDLPSPVNGSRAVEGEDTTPPAKELSIIGSTATSDYKTRLFCITVPSIPVYFSGTGDMLAALLVARLRQAAQEANLLSTAGWQSPDGVVSTDLPLARATEKALASMHVVLKDTARHYEATMEKWRRDDPQEPREGEDGGARREREALRRLRHSRAAEVRVVRNAEALRTPPDLGKFRAQAVQ